MAFQPQGFFQPEPKPEPKPEPNVWQRLRRRVEAIRTYSRRARDVPPIDQTALQRAVIDAANYANNAAVRFGFVVAPIAGAVAVIASLLGTGRPLWFALLMAALGGVVGWTAAVLVVLGFARLRAKGQQRDDARERASELEAQLAASAVPLRVAVECGQQPFWMPLLAENPDAGLFFYIHNVAITNKSDDPVSLKPSLVIDVVHDNYVTIEAKGHVVVPEGFTGQEQLLQWPIDPGPGNEAW